jgi:hypothetical protein
MKQDYAQFTICQRIRWFDFQSLKQVFLRLVLLALLGRNSGQPDQSRNQAWLALERFLIFRRGGGSILHFLIYVATGNGEQRIVRVLFETGADDFASGFKISQSEELFGQGIGYVWPVSIQFSGAK